MNVKPFAVREEVMNKIRMMDSKDVYRVAQLHHAAMGNSLWAQLGQPFLRGLYRSMIKNDLFLGFVYEEEGQIEGFIAGSENTSKMMKRIFFKRWPSLGLRATPALIKPNVLIKLMETGRYFQKSNESLSNIDIQAESLFCSFTPKLRGKKISGHINKVLFDTLLYREHKLVKITTEIDNKGANRQLQSWGFEQKGKFLFYGKDMLLYVLDLEQSNRVESFNWENENQTSNCNTQKK